MHVYSFAQKQPALSYITCIFLSAGVAPKVPKQSALMGATIGALGGFMLAHQQSAGM